jgi:Flp pilus assembly protein TadB
VTISAPIRIVLLVVTALALAASAFVLIEQGSNKTATDSTKSPAAAAVHHASATITHSVSPHRNAAHAAAVARPDALPQTLMHALRYHRVVVAVLYAPGVSGQTGLVAQARAGAHAAHAGFVPLDVRREKLAEFVALRFPNAFDPAVLILDRSGRAVTELDGVQQSTAVAQAVLDARR